MNESERQRRQTLVRAWISEGFSLKQIENKLLALDARQELEELAAGQTGISIMSSQQIETALAFLPDTCLSRHIGESDITLGQWLKSNVSHLPPQELDCLVELIGRHPAISPMMIHMAISALSNPKGQELALPFDSALADPVEGEPSNIQGVWMTHGDPKNEKAPVGGWQAFLRRAGEGRSLSGDREWVTPDRQSIVFGKLRELIASSIERRTIDVGTADPSRQ